MGNSGKKLPGEARTVLATRGWLSSQPEEFRSAILGRAVLRALSPGDRIYEIDDPPGGLYAVCDGYVDVHLATRSDSPRLVHVAQAGWWTGDAAFLSGTTRRAQLTARTAASVAYVDRDRMLQLCAEDPDASRRVAIITVSMLDHALSVIRAQWSDVPQDRVRAALFRLVGDGLLFGLGNDRDPVTFPVNRSDIAELSGLSRNAVGPILQDFSSKGAIELGYRRLIVIDRHLLGRP